jgi:hypothetical protein
MHVSYAPSTGGHNLDKGKSRQRECEWDYLPRNDGLGLVSRESHRGRQTYMHILGGQRKHGCFRHHRDQTIATEHVVTDTGRQEM